MHVSLLVERFLPAPPVKAFALALDPERFPSMFTGFGPIPAIRRITPQALPALGSTRALENSDGSRLTERITAFDPPRQHGYVLEGLRAPLGWLVRAGHADWSFVEVTGGTQVTWRYRFELTSPLAWPLAWLLLNMFMRAAMRRCLDAMAQALSGSPEAAR